MLDSIEKLDYNLGKLKNANKVAKKLMENKVTKKDVDVRRNIMNKLILYFKECSFFLSKKTKTFAEKPAEKLKKFRIEMRKMINEKTLSELKKTTNELIESLEDDIFVLKKVQETKNIYYIENQPHIDDKHFEKIGKLFASNRKIAVLDFRLLNSRGAAFRSSNTGKLLRGFLDNSKISDVYTVTTAASDEAEQIYENGVDFVAKHGIQRKRQNTFDIGILKQDVFDIQSSRTVFGSIDASDKLMEFFSSNFVKKDGYYIFNIPQPLFHRFVDRFYDRNQRLKIKIKHIFRVNDDEMNNLIFVAQYISGDKKTDKLIKMALFQPNRLLSIDDIDETLYYSININKGEFLDPEVVPYILDDDDLTRDFEKYGAPYEEIMEYLKPREKAIELNRPLQEYKIGHLPAVSTTEITNGLYDSHRYSDMIPTGIKYDHLFSAKIIQKDIVEKEKEKHKDEIVDVVTNRKRNIIVMNVLDNDGNEIELLNTED